MAQGRLTGIPIVQDDKLLRLARAYDADKTKGKRALAFTNPELIHIRQLSREGWSGGAIHALIRPDLPYPTFMWRIKKVGIITENTTAGAKGSCFYGRKPYGMINNDTSPNEL